MAAAAAAAVRTVCHSSTFVAKAVPIAGQDCGIAARGGFGGCAGHAAGARRDAVPAVCRGARGRWPKSSLPEPRGGALSMLTLMLTLILTLSLDSAVLSC